MGKITISDPDSVSLSIFAQTLAFWRDLNLTTRSSAQLDKTENLITRTCPRVALARQTTDLELQVVRHG